MGGLFCPIKLSRWGLLGIPAALHCSFRISLPNYIDKAYDEEHMNLVIFEFEVESTKH